MKKVWIIFCLLCVCLLSVMLFSSCTDGDDGLDNTRTEEVITEETYGTSGSFNETVSWKYDEATDTLYFYGTGKVEKSADVDGSDAYQWRGLAENIHFEEGINDADEDIFLVLGNVKSVYLPSTYYGSVPEIKNIEKYIVADNNPQYSSDENGVLFNGDKTKIIRYPKCSPIEIYEIPEGVTSIGYGAFDESENLKSVKIPDSLEYVSASVFKESSVYSNPENWEGDIFYVDTCLADADWETKTEHIIVRDGTKTIASGAFAHCNNIKTITVPDSVKTIGAQAFKGCSSLERVYIGSGVEAVGDLLFSDDIEWSPCSSLKSIEVSKDNKNFTSVDGVLFNKEMTELIQYPTGKKQNEYVIPDSVTSIGFNAFCFCTGLTKLVVGKGITVIDYTMIFHSDSIETVILPETVTRLEHGAFKYSGLKYIDIPDSVTYLGLEAMTGCERLETVNIGKGVSEIHECAIGSSSLKAINVHPENKFYSSERGVLFNKAKTELLQYPASKDVEIYYIPESVTTIKNAAIMEACNLQKIYVGSNVKKIERANFYANIEDDKLGYITETSYEIFYDGTEEQWNKLFVNEYEREEIDKTKVNFY